MKPIKGFRDLTGNEAIKRAEIRKILVETFEKYGYLILVDFSDYFLRVSAYFGKSVSFFKSTVFLKRPKSPVFRVESPVKPGLSPSI